MPKKDLAYTSFTQRVGHIPSTAPPHHATPPGSSKETRSPRHRSPRRPHGDGPRRSSAAVGRTRSEGERSRVNASLHRRNVYSGPGAISMDFSAKTCPSCLTSDQSHRTPPAPGTPRVQQRWAKAEVFEAAGSGGGGRRRTATLRSGPLGVLLVLLKIDWNRKGRFKEK